MTDLDDALNSSAIMWHPATINADWVELPTGVSVGGVDSLRDLGQQIGPSGFQVSHSFDDGLPDPVTMTMGNDASGSLTAELTGRPDNIATTLPTWRLTASGFGTATAIPVTMPSDLASSDYVIVAITVNGTSPVFESTYGVGDPAYSWNLLGTSTDSTFTTYVFGRVHFLATLAPTFQIAVSSPFTWAVVAIGSGATGGPSIVPVRPGTVTSSFETFLGTSHTGPLATLPGRGYLLGVFATANASGPWAPTGTAVELVESTGGTAALQIVRSPWITLDGSYQFVSNSTGSTATAMMLNIPLPLKDRPAMDAMSYFSPFNVSSPVKDFERDTAPVTGTVNVVSPNGVVGQQIFKGQMSDLSINGRLANMNAVSRTRLDLDKSLTLPTVWGNRESCTTDWLASYLLAQGGQYIGVAPSPQTRWWAPSHGSIHPHMDGPNGYATSIFYNKDSLPKGPHGMRPPSTVDGPFQTAMYGQELDQQTEYLYYGADRYWSDTVPGMQGEFNDLLSQKNSVGRLTFWVRGDANDVLPDSWSGTALTDDMLVRATMTVTHPGGSNFLSFRINSARQLVVYLESGVALTGGDIPTDGLWHFVGFVWDYANGVAKARRDSVTWTASGYTSPGFPLVSSEQALYDSGNAVNWEFRARLPVAEIQLEVGPTLYTDLFTRFYPTPTAPSLNATYRPTRKWIEAVAETTPVQGWSTLNDVAKDTLSSLRVNESDNAEMVPLSYFGEAAQMTVLPYNVLSTDVNASELDVILDPSKTRNVVTVEFQETRTDSNRTSILSLTSSLLIPRGVTYVTFALDQRAAEVHGAVDPYGPTSWKITSLTSGQIAAPTTIPNSNVMTVNPSADGGGTVYVGLGFTAFIVGWTNSSVRIRFTNTTSSVKYLANNGQDVPFLRILGYPIKTADGYETVRDAGSVASRRERALTSQVHWIQRRAEAVEWGGTLVSLLSRPRAILALTVMGDPRRTPGMLVSLADAEGTRADGTWRIIGVQHRGNGSMYVQDLQLIRVGTPGVWDSPGWDDSVWGA